MYAAEPRELWGKLNTQLGGIHFEGRVETLAGCYQAFYRNVADAIAGRAGLAVEPEQALNTMRLIGLALESNERKCTLPFST